jgi:diguanylate cyclase (GGDEF)-like protein
MNGFKLINDTYSHAEGDHALRDFAVILLNTYRDSDVTARVGGDEFCVLLTGTSQQDAEIAVSRLHMAADGFNAASGKPYQLEFSTGIACIVAEGLDLKTALNEADLQMYVVKQERKQRQNAANS